MVSVYKEIEIDINDLDSEDLIEVLEERGFKVVDKDDSAAMSEPAKDKIHDFYHDYLLWREFGMRNEAFENIANKFFEEQLDIIVN